MAEHTPGPWIWEYNNLYGRYKINAQLTVVADIMATRSEPVDIANATLIAAAPALLQACKDAVIALDMDNGCIDAVVDKLNEVIAKAEEG